MKKLQAACYVIGVSQIVLGLLSLLMPSFFMGWMGLGVPPQDTNYVLAMLSSRLLVYGVGMFVIARRPDAHRFWIDGMIAIQTIDLGAGLFYTATGTVALAASSPPMFDAFLFLLALCFVRHAASRSTSYA